MKFNAGRQAERRARRHRRPRPTRRSSPTSPTAQNGLKVVQLTAPDTQPKFYGFSPEPKPHADRVAQDAQPGARALARRSSATAPSTRPAARSRYSGASARGRSTSRSSASSISSATARRGRCGTTNQRPESHDCTLQIAPDVALACLLGRRRARRGAAAALRRRTRRSASASCASSLCHGAVETWKGSSVLQNEYVTWSRSDKHARAYTVLLNERSKEIAKKLSLPRAGAPVAASASTATRTTRSAQRGERFRHLRRRRLRSLPRSGRSAGSRATSSPARRTRTTSRAACIPTENDVARAQLCLSCHLGNAQKFVTHKIMAAGHPRMSFELDTFTQIRPPHFRIDVDWQKRKVAGTACASGRSGRRVAAQQLLELLREPSAGATGCSPSWCCSTAIRATTRWRTGATRRRATRRGPGLRAPERFEPAHAAPDRAPRRAGRGAGLRAAGRPPAPGGRERQRCARAGARAPRR